jgi:hypothetical protein
MTTDPTKSLAPQPLPPAEKNALTEMLDSDLAQLSLRELLGMLLSSVGLAERKAYLERVVHDKPNGFYDRSLEVGAIPLDLRVPRTRTGDFRPATLPPLYQRGYSEETQSLLLSLLTSGRSLNAVKDALQKMGLSCSQQELDRVATDLMEELELRNTRPLDPDLLALFLDGKYVEFRDGDRLRPACIYVVVGLRRDGKKQILTCLPGPVAKISPTGKPSCATCSNPACAASSSWCKMIFLDYSPSPRACSPSPTFNSAPRMCSALPKPISAKPMPPSSNSAGEPLNLPGTSKSPISSSNYSATALPKRIPLSSAKLRKKRQHYLAFLHCPEPFRRGCAATAAAISIPRTS